MGKCRSSAPSLVWVRGESFAGYIDKETFITDGLLFERFADL